MTNNNIANGTPRGFNLQNLPGMMTGFPPGFNPVAGQFSGFPAFGNHAVHAPGSWPLNPPMIMNGDETHQSGPIRRGGGRFNNLRTNPYDRRGQTKFNDPRMASMMTVGNPMMRRGGGFGGAGKWGDGAGAQTVGPKEAVQGRTIKKYDDLDAVEGSAGGELNY